MKEITTQTFRIRKNLWVICGFLVEKRPPLPLKVILSDSTQAKELFQQLTPEQKAFCMSTKSSLDFPEDKCVSFPNIEPLLEELRVTAGPFLFELPTGRWVVITAKSGPIENVPFLQPLNINQYNFTSYNTEIYINSQDTVRGFQFHAVQAFQEAYHNIKHHGLPLNFQLFFGSEYERFVSQTLEDVCSHAAMFGFFMAGFFKGAQPTQLKSICVMFGRFIAGTCCRVTHTTVIDFLRFCSFDQHSLVSLEQLETRFTMLNYLMIIGTYYNGQFDNLNGNSTANWDLVNDITQFCRHGTESNAFNTQQPIFLPSFRWSRIGEARQYVVRLWLLELHRLQLLIRVPGVGSFSKAKEKLLNINNEARNLVFEQNDKSLNFLPFKSLVAQSEKKLEITELVNTLLELTACIILWSTKMPIKLLDLLMQGGSLPAIYQNKTLILQTRALNGEMKFCSVLEEDSVDFVLYGLMFLKTLQLATREVTKEELENKVKGGDLTTEDIYMNKPVLFWLKPLNSILKKEFVDSRTDLPFDLQALFKKYQPWKKKSQISVDSYMQGWEGLLSSTNLPYSIASNLQVLYSSGNQNTQELIDTHRVVNKYFNELCGITTRIYLAPLGKYHGIPHVITKLGLSRVDRGNMGHLSKDQKYVIDTLCAEQYIYNIFEMLPGPDRTDAILHMVAILTKYIKNRVHVILQPSRIAAQQLKMKLSKYDIDYSGQVYVFAYSDIKELNRFLQRTLNNKLLPGFLFLDDVHTLTSDTLRVPALDDFQVLCNHFGWAQVCGFTSAMRGIPDIIEQLTNTKVRLRRLITDDFTEHIDIRTVNSQERSIHSLLQLIDPSKRGAVMCASSEDVREIVSYANVFFGEGFALPLTDFLEKRNVERVLLNPPKLVVGTSIIAHGLDLELDYNVLYYCPLNSDELVYWLGMLRQSSHVKYSYELISKGTKGCFKDIPSVMKNFYGIDYNGLYISYDDTDAVLPVVSVPSDENLFFGV